VLTDPGIARDVGTSRPPRPDDDSGRWATRQDVAGQDHQGVAPSEEAEAETALAAAHGGGNGHAGEVPCIDLGLERARAVLTWPFDRAGRASCDPAKDDSGAGGLRRAPWVPTRLCPTCLGPDSQDKANKPEHDKAKRVAPPGRRPSQTEQRPTRTGPAGGHSPQRTERAEAPGPSQLRGRSCRAPCPQEFAGHLVFAQSQYFAA